jgi:hypothetical protein
MTSRYLGAHKQPSCTKFIKFSTGLSVFTPNIDMLADLALFQRKVVVVPDQTITLPFKLLGNNVKLGLDHFM